MELEPEKVITYDYFNVFLASGSLDAIKLSEDDRRWFDFKYSEKVLRLDPDFNFKDFISNKIVEIKDDRR